MLGALVDAQTLERRGAQAVAGQHALDRDHHGLVGLFSHQGAVVDLFQAADPAGMGAVELLVQLGAGQDGLVTVDDDDMVAAIDVRGEDDLVFAAQQNGCLGGNTAQRLASGIPDVPLALDLAGFC